MKRNLCFLLFLAMTVVAVFPQQRHKVNTKRIWLRIAVDLLARRILLFRDGGFGRAGSGRWRRFLRNNQRRGAQAHRGEERNQQQHATHTLARAGLIKRRLARMIRRAALLKKSPEQWPIKTSANE